GRGKEAQGKPVEALKAYLELQAFPAGDELFRLPEDPAVKAPLHVFVAGRVRALLEKATPAQRKELEGEIEQRWKDLNKSDDSEKMRGFIRIFGTHSPAGREAVLRLAELSKEKPSPEAENLLLQLRTQRDDPAQAARAVETLARRCMDKGMLDDAFAW